MLALLPLAIVPSAPGMPVPIILDTDAGDDVDDAYAICLAARWPAVRLLAVTCVWGPTLSRAKLARKLLDLCGARDVPVFSADTKEGSNPQLDWAADYPYQRPDESAAEAIVRIVNENPGRITLVTIGALSNAAKALELDPNLPDKLHRLVIMGGLVGQPAPEYNARCDPPATQRVFACGADITMVGLDVTMKARLIDPWMKRLREAGKPWTQALEKLTEVWPHDIPILHDPLALSCVSMNFCKFEPMHIEVDSEGRTQQVEGEPNARVAVDVDADGFLDWYVATVGS